MLHLPLPEQPQLLIQQQLVPALSLSFLQPNSPNLPASRIAKHLCASLPITGNRLLPLPRQLGWPHSSDPKARGRKWSGSY